VPPPVRTAMAELLLLLRLELLPKEDLDSSQIGRARYDVRGLAELFKHLATRTKPTSQTSWTSTAQAYSTTVPPHSLPEVPATAIRNEDLEEWRAFLYQPSEVKSTTCHLCNLWQTCKPEERFFTCQWCEAWQPTHEEPCAAADGAQEVDRTQHVGPNDWVTFELAKRREMLSVKRSALLEDQGQQLRGLTLSTPKDAQQLQEQKKKQHPEPEARFKAPARSLGSRFRVPTPWQSPASSVQGEEDQLEEPSTSTSLQTSTPRTQGWTQDRGVWVRAQTETEFSAPAESALEECTGHEDDDDESDDYEENLRAFVGQAPTTHPRTPSPFLEKGHRRAPSASSSDRRSSLRIITTLIFFFQLSTC